MRSFDSEGNSVQLAACNLPLDQFRGAVEQAYAGGAVPMVITGDQETGVQFRADTVMPAFDGGEPTLIGNLTTKTRMPEGDLRETCTPAVATVEPVSRRRRVFYALMGVPLEEVRLTVMSDVGFRELPPEV